MDYEKNFHHYLSKLVCHPTHFSNLGSIALIFGYLFLYFQGFFLVPFLLDLTHRSVMSPLKSCLPHFLLTLPYIWLLYIWPFLYMAYYRHLLFTLFLLLGYYILLEKITTLTCSTKSYDYQTQLGPSIILGNFFLCYGLLPLPSFPVPSLQSKLS